MRSWAGSGGKRADLNALLDSQMRWLSVHSRTTAECEEAILVTENRRLARRARELGVEVWTAHELVAFVEAL